jgi:hypothetical protein
MGLSLSMPSGGNGNPQPIIADGNIAESGRFVAQKWL